MKKRINDTIKLAKELLERGGATRKETDRLERKIAYFQHERFAHLITTAFVGLAAMISLVVFISLVNYLTFALLAALVLLFAAYILHYYVLENGVQRLNDLIDELYDRLALGI
ncbi:MAG: hypothetical protein LBT81_00955 [Helicobacteraceae bacterium]|jgi:Flp pilus assembly protein TadB|nr:hypothetical protein [Helicobacteraceae bacterium]